MRHAFLNWWRKEEFIPSIGGYDPETGRTCTIEGGDHIRLMADIPQVGHLEVGERGGVILRGTFVDHDLSDDSWILELDDWQVGDHEAQMNLDQRLYAVEDFT